MAGPLPVLVLVFANQAGGPALEAGGADAVRTATNQTPIISAAAPGTLNVSLDRGITPAQVGAVSKTLTEKLGCSAGPVTGGTPEKGMAANGRMVMSISPYKVTYTGCTVK